VRSPSPQTPRAVREGDGAPRTQLVLDIGGVLLTAHTRPMMRALVGADVDAEALHALFSGGPVKADLWTGRMSVDDFYAWMGTQGMTCGAKEARERIRRCITELPAVGRLGAWAEHADLHVMSNHVTEWLREPFLDRHGRLFGCLAVSDQVGYRKPDDGMYRFVADRVEHRGPVLYVDDKERNLAPARALGWDVLLADRAGAWVAQVDDLLGCSP
jgi:FMN phosphatase YigB (HAD superfamily)